LRIGLDIDGTIRDIVTPLYRLVGQLYPNMKIDPIEEWKDYQIWKYFHGLDEKQLKEIWFNKYAEGIYFYTARPYKDFWKIKDELFSKHEVVYLTAQPNSKTRDLTLRWLEYYNIENHEIHFVDYDKKHLVECDVYIEDSPAQQEMILGIQDEWLVCLLVKRPWTENHNSFSWKQIMKKLEVV